jgi:predicted RNA binding protein YcfA (HicA-like mRNA interferase family)
MSGRLPALKPKDVFRALTRAGFVLHHTTGSHYILKHPDRPTSRVVIPWHNKDLKLGTLRSILDQSGYSVDEFRKFL